MLNFSALILLFMTACRPCFALQENEDVSRERAKELGVTLRSSAGGENGVTVWLEFAPKGVLKNFTRVDLEIGAPGSRMAAAPLLTSRPTAEQISVHFSTDPVYLPVSVLTIVVQNGERDRVGYRFKVKDFIEAEAKKSADAVAPVYATAEQVKAMPPCQATVEHMETFSALLRTADGRQFGIGSERGAQEVWHFVGTALKQGQTYEFPRAFLDYQKRKFYVTAEEIKAMPPVKATLELAAPCYSIFRTDSGQQFVIGDPGSGREVWRFLGTLEKGQSYPLPSAFIDYEKKQPPPIRR